MFRRRIHELELKLFLNNIELLFTMYEKQSESSIPQELKRKVQGVQFCNEEIVEFELLDFLKRIVLTQHEIFSLDLKCEANAFEKDCCQMK